MIKYFKANVYFYLDLIQLRIVHLYRNHQQIEK